MHWVLETVSGELLKQLFIALFGAIVTALFSAIGFFFALSINRRIRKRTEKKTFKSMLIALRAEAKSNLDVLSSWQNYRGKRGVVLKDFRTATAQALLASSIFMEYLSSFEIEIMHKYVTTLMLMNGYRRAREVLKFQATSNSEQWLPSVEKYSYEELDNSEERIKQIEMFRS
jgi:hypothetical protein